MADVKTEIQALYQKMDQEFQPGNEDVIFNYFTEDCKILPPHIPMVVGKEGVKKLFDDMKFFETLGKLEHSVTEVVVSREDTATTISKVIMRSEDGKALDEVKSMVVWKKVNGAWKVHRDIWNSDKPMPETPK